MSAANDPQQRGDQKRPKPPKSGLGTLLLHHSITALILILLLGLGVWSYLTFLNKDYFATVDHEAFSEHIEPPLIEAQRQRIINAIEVWSLEHSQPPSTLRDLVDQGLLVTADLYSPRGNRAWHYERLPENYQLTHIGDEPADGEASAGDTPE